MSMCQSKSSQCSGGSDRQRDMAVLKRKKNMWEKKDCNWLKVELEQEKPIITVCNEKEAC